MKTVLIVEDEKSIVQMIRSILEQEGYGVREAFDGKEALELLGIDPPKNDISLPDLVLLDIMMPIVDGYTVASKMQDNDHTRRVPVIILTAKEPMREVLEASPNVRAYLDKPFEPSVLCKTVKEILASADSSETGRARRYRPA